MVNDLAFLRSHFLEDDMKTSKKKAQKIMSLIRAKCQYDNEGKLPSLFSSNLRFPQNR